MRVLVTGASGFIGRRLLPALADAGHEVTALLLPGDEIRLDAASRIVRGDITQPDSLAGLPVEHDAIVHLAGAVGYGQTFARCTQLNVAGTANIAREAVACGVRRFVHMSSVSVYGRVADVRIAEDFPLRKIGDPYGDTKIDAEDVVRAWAERGELEVTVVRPTVIYGPGDDRFLPKLVENLRAGRARVIGSGANRVDAIHVDDVVRFLALVLADERAVGGVYNLNNPSNPRWGDLIDLVARTIGVEPPRRHLPYGVALALAALTEAAAYLRGQEPRLTRYAVRVIGRSYEYATDRARSELGFEPRVNMSDAIRDLASAPPP